MNCLSDWRPSQERTVNGVSILATTEVFAVNNSIQKTRIKDHAGVNRGLKKATHTKDHAKNEL